MVGVSALVGVVGGLGFVVFNAVGYVYLWWSSSCCGYVFVLIVYC